MEKKLYRDEHRKVIAGVCAGLADYFSIDVSIIRLLFALTLILKGGGVLIYIVLWIVLPKRGYDYIPPVNYTVPPADPNAPVPPYQAASPGYKGTPYNAPFQQPYAPYVPPRKGPSTAGIIGGLVLILLGAGFLIDELDIIPDWSFDQWWPIILVVIGIALIFTGRDKNHIQPQWQQPEAKPAEPTPATDEPATDHPSNEKL